MKVDQCGSIERSRLRSLVAEPPTGEHCLTVRMLFDSVFTR